MIQISHAAGHAVGPDKPCIPPPYPAREVHPLVEEVKEQGPFNKPVGAWLNRETSVFLKGKETICLASTRDGTGRLRVDDEIDLQVTLGGRIIGGWQHDFHDYNTGGITDTASVDISHLFSAGKNEIRIILNDFFAPNYSTSPIWLIIWDAATPTPSPTNTPVPTSTPYPTSTPRPTYTPAPPLPTSTPWPTYTPNPTPTPLPTPSPLVGIGAIKLPPRIERGQPFTFTVELSSKEPTKSISMTANVKDAKEKFCQRGITLTKQEDEENSFAGQASALNQTGVYSLTVHLEGITKRDVEFGKDSSLDKTVSFKVVTSTLEWILRGIIGALVLGLVALGVFRWYNESLKMIPLGSLRVLQPPQKRGQIWRLDDFGSKEVVLGLDAGHISLVPGQLPVGLYARFYGRKEREEVVTYVAGLQNEQPLRLSGTPLGKGEKARLFEGSRLEVGDHVLEYVAPRLETY